MTKADVAFKEFDAAIKKKYSDIASALDTELFEITADDVLSTGILSLDIASGTGGLVLGRVLDLFGQEASGKSMLAYHIMGEAIKKRNMKCLLFDVEGTANHNFMKMLGLDTNHPNFRILQTPEKLLSAEDWINVLETALETHAASVITIDSIPSLVPREIIEKSAGESKRAALQAQLLSERLPKIVGLAKASKTLVILINQIRQAPMVMFGSPDRTTGGNAIKFYSSYRLEVKPVKKEQGKIIVGSKVIEKIVGHYVKYTFKKNKLAPYDSTAEFYVDFYHGIDYLSDLIECAMLTDVIGKRGTSIFVYPNDASSTGVNGNKAIRDHIVNNNLIEEIRVKVLERVTHENTGHAINMDKEELEELEEPVKLEKLVKPKEPVELEKPEMV